MQKTSEQNILCYIPLKFSESAKMEAKITVALYHRIICSGYSVPEVMSWKSCLGSPPLKSCPGSPILATVYWQSCPGCMSWHF
jgi:hypothetical protein